VKEGIVIFIVGIYGWIDMLGGDFDEVDFEFQHRG